MGFDGEISATYKDGILRPDRQLRAPDGARLMLTVRQQGPTAESRRQGWDVIDRIRREGLIRLHGMRWTRDDLYDRR